MPNQNSTQNQSTNQNQPLDKNQGQFSDQNSQTSTSSIGIDNTIPANNDLPPIPDFMTQNQSLENTTPNDQYGDKKNEQDSKSSANSYDLPPTIASPKKKFGGGRVVATILGILLLIGGLGAGVYITQQQQIFQQKAAGTTPCYDVPSFDNTKVRVVEKTSIMITKEIDMSDPKMTGSSKFLSTKANENYFITRSDENGNYSATGKYITISMKRTTTYTDGRSGLNIDAVILIDKTTGKEYPATQVIKKVRGNSLTSGYNDTAENALGPADGAITHMGDPSSSITLGFACPTTASAPSCSGIKIYDTSWNLLSSSGLKSLSSGTVVRLAVSGNSSSGVITKAKFTVNGNERSEVTQVKSGTTEFYDEYTIPNDTTEFNIDAKLYHSEYGWF